jgi:hypothetical protein
MLVLICWTFVACMLEFKRGHPLIVVVAGVVEANRLVNSTSNHWIEQDVIHGDAPLLLKQSKVVQQWRLLRKRRMTMYNEIELCNQGWKIPLLIISRLCPKSKW